MLKSPLPTEDARHGISNQTKASGAGQRRAPRHPERREEEGTHLSVPRPVQPPSSTQSQLPRPWIISSMGSCCMRGNACACGGAHEAVWDARPSGRRTPALHRALSPPPCHPPPAHTPPAHLAGEHVNLHGAHLIHQGLDLMGWSACIGMAEARGQVGGAARGRPPPSALSPQSPHQGSTHRPSPTSTRTPACG